LRHELGVALTRAAQRLANADPLEFTCIAAYYNNWRFEDVWLGK
jgi:hypothetical protein